MTSDSQSVPYLRLARGGIAPDDVAGQHAAPPELPAAVGADPVPARWEAGQAAGHATPAQGTRPTAVVTEPPSRSLETRLFALDAVCVTAAWVGLGIRLVTSPAPLDRAAPGLAGAAVTLLAMRALQLYRSRRCARRAEELWRIALASLWGAAAFTVLAARATPPGAPALACAAATVVTVGTVRWQYGRFLRAQRARGRHLRGVILVGSGEDVAELHTMLQSEPELGYAVTGVVGDGVEGQGRAADLPVSPSVADIAQLAARTGATGVVIVPSGLSGDTVRRAIADAAEAHLHVQLWPGLRGVGSRRLRSVPISGEPFFYVEPRAVARWQLATKRLIDVVGAGVGLLLAAPVIGVAAVLIWLEDGGPVLHRGPRIGKHGVPFIVYKLRTMSSTDGVPPSVLAELNERTDGPLFKASRDPRVTRVGRILRASSIDELPQLWNVLQGVMSLVGPRPALPGEVIAFDEDLRRRHSVPPGITGLWQVEARRNPSFHAYRRLDLRYVDDWSLLLDLAILVSTVPSVISQAVGELWSRRRHR